jgi:hypothetical protein
MALRVTQQQLRRRGGRIREEESQNGGGEVSKVQGIQWVASGSKPHSVTVCMDGIVFGCGLSLVGAEELEKTKKPDVHPNTYIFIYKRL